LTSGCRRERPQSADDLYRDADQARRRGEYRAALARAGEGFGRCRNSGDSTCAVRFQLLEAEILLTQNRVAEARPMLESPPAAISQSAAFRARWLLDLAELRRQSDQLDEARKLVAQARDLASGAGDPALVAWIELKRGVLLADFDQADGAFRRALEIARAQHDEFLAAGALGDRVGGEGQSPRPPANLVSASWIVPSAVDR